jgi:Na+-driven multidrug efflux pump
VWLAVYFLANKSVLRFILHEWKPRFALWRRMLAIGLPAGFEFVMTAVYLIIVYTITRPFGAAAQAGFGIGMRVIQAGFMPVVALGFSVAPVAGQNFGARLPERVKATFKDAALMAGVVMLLFAIVCHIVPRQLVGIFSDDPAVLDVGAEYLRIISYNYIAAGLIFVASSMFQAMGNTMPSLISSAARISLVALALAFLSRLPDFQLVWIWYVSVAATLVQLALSMLLLRHEFGRKLGVQPAPAFGS